MRQRRWRLKPNKQKMRRTEVDSIFSGFFNRSIYHASSAKAYRASPLLGVETTHMKSMFAMGTALAGGLLACANVAFAQDDEEESYVYLYASLSGSEVKGGDEEVSGSFSAEADLTTGEMCYFLDAAEVDGATTAHIHKGGKGKNGAAVVTLEITAEDAEEDSCTAVDTALLKQIAEQPKEYYVQVHSDALPAGAVRGQLEE